MRKITWQSRSRVVTDSFREKHLSLSANGGNAYDFHAAMALSETFDFTMSEDACMRPDESTWRYWYRMHRHRPDADAVIMEPYPIVFGRRWKGIKSVGMIHHIDEELAGNTIKHSWYFNRLKTRLQHLDLVIAVSKYWEERLGNLGCRNIRVIYNSFEPSDYGSTTAKTDAFRKKYIIPAGKPLVYIGNANRRKGAYEIYGALKNSGFHLIMSGSSNQAQDLPVQYLQLTREEYLALLATSDVVVTFSTMTEGWNRIAHEALLSKTPVIGSGIGGMRELLEGAGQKIVTDPSLLEKAIHEVIANRYELGAMGYQYTSRFDRKYFTQAWTETIRELLHS